jgi:branched-chain amino acid transport system ATP-binding protein
MNILETQGIVAGYGRTTILNGCSVRVRQGVLTTVIGPNGAGKSTLFKAIFGMIPVREGRVLFAGTDVTTLKPLERIAHGMAYVPQGRNIFSQLSVAHNLEFGGVSLRNLAETRRRMERIYQQFPILKKRANAQAGTLSGGEQKILEIGRALLMQPKLLLIDEPSIGLSPLMVEQAMGELVALRGSGVSVLLIEQNAKKALAISDDAIVLQQGRLALDGPAQAVLNHPDIGHLFLGGVVKAGAA